MGGTKYLRQLLDRFAGDAVKALAAYIAGPQRVEQYGGVPPYRETRAYVTRIIDDYNRKKLQQQATFTRGARRRISGWRQPAPRRLLDSGNCGHRLRACVVVLLGHLRPLLVHLLQLLVDAFAGSMSQEESVRPVSPDWMYPAATAGTARTDPAAPVEAAWLLGCIGAAADSKSSPPAPRSPAVPERDCRAPVVSGGAAARAAGRTRRRIRPLVPLAFLLSRH